MADSTVSPRELGRAYRLTTIMSAHNAFNASRLSSDDKPEFYRGYASACEEDSGQAKALMAMADEMDEQARLKKLRSDAGLDF